DSSIGLITAKLDLQLVRMLRQAMRVADLSSGCGCHGDPEPRLCVEPRPRLHPSAVIEPRQRISPAVRIEPRKVAHPRPIELNSTPQASLSHPEDVRVTKSPIQPPWRVLPWEKLAPPAPKLKVDIRRFDVPAKGTVLDVFI